jgi:5-oxoprolinase (ATP-hydrolysing)
MTPAPSDGSFDYQEEFLSSYRREYGFILEDTNVVVDDVRVRGIGKTYDTLGHSIFDEMAQLQFTKLDRLSTKVETETSVFFTEVGRQDVPVYMLGKLNIGDVACGPAIIVDGTQTIVLDPKSEAKVCSKHLFISLSI